MTSAINSTQTQTLIMSRRAVRFMLHEWLVVGQLTERRRFSEQSGDMYDDVLELAERLATERLAPHNRSSDDDEPRIDGGRVVIPPGVEQALGAIAEAGMFGASLPVDAGGLQLPLVVTTAASAWFQAANAGTYAYAMLTTAAANLLVAHGSPEQIERWAVPMIEGRYFGTMCLSEPQAGSSLSDITTTATPARDGTYRLRGTKMWISGGEHEMAENIVHMVLARTPDAPPGVRGTSLFIVPRRLVEADGGDGPANDIALAGLNHKMGYRGTVNTILSFGEGAHRPCGQPGAVGYLVGSLGAGIATMFHMMNEARIGVGVAATGIGYTGYLKSLRYASERPQGRPDGGSRDANGSASTRQVPIIEHADVRRMLLAQKCYVDGALALVLYCSRLHDDTNSLEDPSARDDARVLLETLTPIAKSWPSQWCLKANSLAIQIHGGYGYAREYDVEQHYRDNRLNAIHEGTHGIQARDLLGRKMRIDGGRGMDLLAQRIEATATATGSAEAASLGRELLAALSRLRHVTSQLAGVDDGSRLVNASIYLEAAGHIVVAWLWLELYHAADDEHDTFHLGLRQAARFFYRYELPRVGPQLDLLAAGDRTTLEMVQEWFSC